jgi:5-methylcytosine-specific restriction endonuclease McrA
MGDSETPDRKSVEIELAWALHERRGRASGALTPTLRERLAGQQNWRCCYCGIRMEGGPSEPTFEHIVPRARGGTDDESNLVIACRRCNSNRGHRYRREHLLAVRALRRG